MDDPAFKLVATEVAAGGALFNGNCSGCHGKDAESSGAPGPDLRESGIALDRAALWSVLHDGALLRRGMPRFQAFSEAEVGQIQQFIRERARAATSARGDHAK